MNEIAPAAEREFNRWYEREMIPSRLARDGFNSARRYRAVGDVPSYLTVYGCESLPDLVNSMATPGHDKARARMRRKFRNVQLSACDETWSHGSAVGAQLILVQCSAQPGRDADARAFIRNELLDSMRSVDGMVRMALWEANPHAISRFQVDSIEELRHYTHWLLALDSHGLAKGALMVYSRLLAQRSATHGMLVGSISRYQLLSSHGC